MNNLKFCLDKCLHHFVLLTDKIKIVHFKQWIRTSPEVKADEYNKVCQLCFPLARPVTSSEAAQVTIEEQALGVPEEVAKDLGSDSSSDSSSSD